MGNQIYPAIRAALETLEPEPIQKRAARPVEIGLIASSRTSYLHMKEFLAPLYLSGDRRRELAGCIHKAGDGTTRCDVVLCEEELLGREGAFPFYAAEPRRTVREVLNARPKLDLALASRFPAFRQPVIARIIRGVARDNALFTLLTALPALFPNLPPELSRIGSDTPVLTMNQVRMAFTIAAASNQQAGFEAQRGQIAAIVGGAVAWRTLAHELARRVPYGDGLIPKALIAYAGTYTVGVGLERFCRLGYELTREERELVFDKALEQARQIVAALKEGK